MQFMNKPSLQILVRHHHLHAIQFRDTKLPLSKWNAYGQGQEEPATPSRRSATWTYPTRAFGSSFIASARPWRKVSISSAARFGFTKLASVADMIAVVSVSATTRLRCSAFLEANLRFWGAGRVQELAEHPRRTASCLPSFRLQAPPAQWIASTYSDSDPRYSATGEQILFFSTRSGRKPWIADRQGRNPQMVAVNGRFYGSPSWSPNGGRIAYDARIDSVAQVMVVSALGGTPKPVTSDRFENIVPSWSHDGQWIYCSNRSGRHEIWRVRPNGGASEQVTQKGGFDSQETRDGKYLYFSRSRTAPDIWRRTPDSTEEILVPEVAGRIWVAGK